MTAEGPKNKPMGTTIRGSPGFGAGLRCDVCTGSQKEELSRKDLACTRIQTQVQLLLKPACLTHPIALSSTDFTLAC